MLKRPALHSDITAALARSPAVALVGPRQVGKTTIARLLAAEAQESHWFDLEDPVTLAQFAAPMTALAPLRGLVVIDEVQHVPELFKLLRVLIDRVDDRVGGHVVGNARNQLRDHRSNPQPPASPSPPARFLLLGSASPALLRQAGESLAGRIEVIEAGGFTIAETGPAALDALWWRGGFPRAFTAGSDQASRVWRREFIRSTVERDLPQLGMAVPAPAIHRFWSMLAHYHGQVWNAAEPARSLGVNESTVRRYLDWLTEACLVRQLQPWFANLGKRQVKAPKIYVRDSGLLHELLGIASPQALLRHPKSGASWEGVVVDQVLRIARPDEAWFWATHGGAELDLLLMKDGQRIGVEIKRADAPTLTRSMHSALADLQLDALYVVYPGTRRYRLADKVEVVPLSALIGP